MNLFHDIIRDKSLRSRLQLGRTFRLVWRSAPGWTLLNGFWVLFEGLLPLLNLYFLKRVVDALAAGIQGSEGLTPEAFSGAVVPILALAAVAALAAVFKAGGRLVVEAHAEAVNDYVQGIVQAQSVAVDFEAYECPEYHDLVQQVQSQATFRPARIARGFFVAIRSLISGVGLTAFIVVFSWQLGVLLVIFSLPGVWVRLKHAHRLLEWQGRQSTHRRRSGYLHGLLAGSAYAKEVRLYGAGKVLRQWAATQRRVLRKARLQLESRRALLELIPHLSAVVALLASVWIVARKAMRGVITLGDIVIYYQAFHRCQAALSEFLNALVHLYEDSLFLGLLYGFLDIRPRVVSPTHPRLLPERIEQGIRIVGLAFRYPGTKHDVLSDLNLTLPAGHMLALVGENGAGKSTLAKLLCRLYDPTDGRILLDGVDIREFDLAAYRRLIGVVFQDFNQYNLSVTDNIRLGNLGLPEDDPRISQAASDAGLDGFMNNLGQGIATILGREFQGGEALSAGQWQRVALARALVRESPVLIMDEPTSAMDPKAEHELYKTLSSITASRTTLLISHRLSTVTMADHIAALDHGRVVEQGSHDELQRQGGLYADLFERQSRAYR